MLNLSDAWKQAMARSGVQPVYRATLTLGPILYFTVSDYTAASGTAITITAVTNRYAGGTHTDTVVYTEGVQWSAAGSNAQAAASLAHAIGGIVVTGPNTSASYTNIPAVISHAYSNVVAVLPNDTTGIMVTVTGATSNSAAVPISPTAVPYQTSFCSDDYVGRVASEFPIIADVTNVRNSMDPQTRQVSIGSIDIVMSEAGGIFRELLSRSYPHNRLLQLQLGAAELSLGDFAPVGSYVIDEIIPQPGAITLRAMEPIILANEATFVGNIFGQHPATVIWRLLRTMGLPQQYFDSATLDASTSAFQANSHWAVTRNNWYTTEALPAYNGTSTFRPWPNANTGISQPTSVKQLIDELSVLCNGALAISEGGLYSFRIYDPTAASVRSLGDDDIDEFTQVHTVDNQITQVQVIGAQNDLGNTLAADSQSGFMLANVSDYIAAATYAPGTIQTQKTYKINTQWLGMPCFLYNSIDGSVGTITVVPPTMAAFCGTVPSETALAESVATAFAAHFPSVPLPQPVQSIYASLNESASPPRFSYLLLTDGFRAPEVIQMAGHTWITQYVGANLNNGDSDGQSNFVVDVIDSVQFVANSTTYHNNLTPAAVLPDGTGIGQPDSSWLGYPITLDGNGDAVDNLPSVSGPAFYGISHFIINQRDYDGGGANPRSWNADNVNYPGTSTRVYDVTIARDTATKILDRFKQGAPVVRCRVPLAHWDLQIGDFVTLFNDVYIGIHTSSAAGQAVFEITGKELLTYADSPGIMLELTWARDNITPAAAPFTGQPGGVSPTGSSPQAITDNELNIIVDSHGNPVTL